MGEKCFVNADDSEEVRSTINGIFKEQLTKCITELQLLDAETNDPNFEIGSDEDYSPYQRDFIVEFFSCLKIHEVSADEMIKAMNEGISVDDFIDNLEKPDE